MRRSGKYSSELLYAAAFLKREALRRYVADLVHWEPLRAAEPGCTAIIGMCSKLPDVLPVNLACLERRRWPELRDVIVAVDCRQEDLNASFERDLQERFPSFRLRTVFYDERLYHRAERLKLPFVYSWASWCNAISRTTTETFLIHDYDALIISDQLESRYREHLARNTKMQGVSWYGTNGIEVQDRLTATFEAFVDTRWVRERQPIDLFNKVGRVDGRGVDFDTLLHLQLRDASPDERSVVPMGEDALVHPTQMIHQYTMFRRKPGAPLPCFSVVMIPTFQYASGDRSAFRRSAAAVRNARGTVADLLGDGTQVNLRALERPSVDWVLKQSLAALDGVGLDTPPEFIEYGNELYRVTGARPDEYWVGDFLPRHRPRIDALRQARAL